MQGPTGGRTASKRPHMGTIKPIILITMLALSTGVKGLADWGYKEKNHVVQLDSGTHNNFLKKFRYSVVVYITPNCNHCDKTLKIFSKVALFFKNFWKRIPFAVFDCSSFEKTCSRLLIPSYPYIKFYYKNVHSVDFLKKRSKSNLKNFVKKMIRRKLYKIDSLDKYERVKENDTEVEDFHLVVYLKKANAEVKETMKILAMNDQNARYAYLSFRNNSEEEKESILKELGRPQSALVYVDGKGKIFEYPGKLDVEDVTNWVFDLRNPGVIEIGDEFVNKVIFGQNHALVLFVKSKTGEMVKKFSDAVLDFKKDIVCAVSSEDAKDTETNSRLRKEMKINSRNDQFQLFYVDPIHDFVFRKWKFDGKLNKENLKIFLESVWEGHIEPYFFSETPPLANVNAIKVRDLRQTVHSKKLVASEFKKYVKFRAKESVILIVSEDCLDCDYVVDRYENDSQIQFFILNGDKNELPDFSWTQTPVIIAYSRYPEENAQQFNRKLTISNLIKFIDGIRQGPESPNLDTEL